MRLVHRPCLGELAYHDGPVRRDRIVGRDEHLRNAEPHALVRELVAGAVQPPDREDHQRVGARRHERVVAEAREVVPRADEVDAALDNINVKKVCAYVKSRSKDFQCIVISLKDQFYHEADSLVGIAKNCATTSSISLTVDLTKYDAGDDDDDDAQQ